MIHPIKKNMNKRLFTFPLTLLPALLLAHEGIWELQPYEVTGRAAPLMGETVSASQGVIGQVDLEYRPILRTGEILETIPGFIATQHSGTGKGNQYFLRGFNLDHGTDFATFVDGMPVNMPTHGHGHGYSDINFVIPELIDTIQYMKGPYFAGVGDFSSAGSSHIATTDFLDRGLAVLNFGEDSFLRGVVADSTRLGKGDLLAAFEGQYYDGPWAIGENLNKANALLKYSETSGPFDYGITFMGYDATWDSADQIPLRAVRDGRIGPLDSLDDDLGGASSRFSLSGNFTRRGNDSISQGNLYAIYYDLTLWSNFTYFLENPVRGDEFEQVDQRRVYGGQFVHTFTSGNDWSLRVRHKFGIQARLDDIGEVGLHQTSSRERFNTVREDDVLQLSGSAFYENEVIWTDHLKSIFGLRADYFHFDVDSNLPANSGSERDARLSPKLNLVYSATDELEFYFSAGLGFHSNDARGTTITVDPTDGRTPVQPVDPLVESRGTEIGSRVTWNSLLNSSLSLWYLDFDSELLFVGDAGITEPSRPSTRYGIELANYLTPFEGFTLEFDAAFTEARFDDDDPAGDSIPGALDTVLSTAATWQSPNGWVHSIRLRYFGPRALSEDGLVESDSSLSVNLRTGFQTEDWSFIIDVLNLFDSSDDDITYFYASRLPGEPAGGIEDIHFHPIEPRTVRAYLRFRF